MLQRQQLLLQKQQQLQLPLLQSKKQQPCSDELMDEIRALDALYPPLLLLQRGCALAVAVAAPAAVAALATIQQIQQQFLVCSSCCCCYCAAAALS